MQEQSKQTIELKTFEFEIITVDSAGEIVSRENSSAQYFEEDLVSIAALI